MSAAAKEKEGEREGEKERERARKKEREKEGGKERTRLSGGKVIFAINNRAGRMTVMRQQRWQIMYDKTLPLASLLIRKLSGAR